MNIETYQDGQLVDSRETEDLPLLPDWGNFNREMYPSPGYARIRTATANQDAKATMETLTIATGIAASNLEGQDLIFLKTHWDLVIGGLGEGQSPTPEEISQWNAIALAANMKFSFSENGLMVLLEE